MQKLSLEMGNRKVEILGAEFKWQMRLTTDGIKRGKQKEEGRRAPTLLY
jgi:hypothetical protein